MPYGVAASARAAIAKAVIVRTFCCSSTKPALNKYLKQMWYTGESHAAFFTEIFLDRYKPSPENINEVS